MSARLGEHLFHALARFVELLFRLLLCTLIQDKPGRKHGNCRAHNKGGDNEPDRETGFHRKEQAAEIVHTASLKDEFDFITNAR